MSEVVKIGTLPAEQASSVLSIIERASRDPNVDIEKLERLMAMKERMEAKEALNAFNAALVAAQSEIPSIFKGEKNSQTNSKYADYKKIIEQVQPYLIKYGISVSFGTDASTIPGHYGVTCRVGHEQGHVEHYRVDIPPPTKGPKGNAVMTETHGFGAAMTYARRYLFCMIFNISMSDDADGNLKNQSAFISADQVQQILSDLRACNGDVVKLCEALKVPEIPQIQQKDYARVMKHIAARRAKQ